MRVYIYMYIYTHIYFTYICVYMYKHDIRKKEYSNMKYEASRTDRHAYTKLNENTHIIYISQCGTTCAMAMLYMFATS